ncbi:MAG: L,D-transpeptidase [Pseudonocardia sp.]|nr:L,D-transpeptidase [Pseudonocardia sp.]
MGVGAVVAAGLVTAGQVALADPAQPPPAAQAARAEPLVAGTPCSNSAKSCVDLESQRAWLFQDGKVLRGPVPIASGGMGQETPVGHSLRVYRKEKDHVSSESFTNGVPDGMPYSVFFEDGGIAFHAGDPDNSSGGCIHLDLEDAKAWFAYLQIGDKVQVVKHSAEMAARGLPVDPSKGESEG